MFSFTLNLHQESLDAPYWIWYYWKDEFSLFKMVYCCKSINFFPRKSELTKTLYMVLCSQQWIFLKEFS